jgi:hypothetical protein
LGGKSYTLVIEGCEESCEQSASEANKSDMTKKEGEALLFWLAFMLASILTNATTPFMLGADVRTWTD